MTQSGHPSPTPALFRCAGLSRYDALSRASGKAMRRRGAEKEKRGHKAARPKRRIGLGVTHRRGASTADLQEQLDHRTRELRESLEQQTATAEILRIISSSPTDVQRVFDTIVRNFVSLCGGISGSISTFDGKLVHLAGAYGF